MSLTEDTVNVAIDAPAREGEANAAICEYMAEASVRRAVVIRRSGDLTCLLVACRCSG